MNIKVFFTGFAKPRRVARFFLVGFLFLAACSGGPSAEEPKSKERLAVPVIVASVFTKDVPIQVSSVGNVEAYSTVAVKSRVSGELVGVHFQEGQEVKEGDPLFTIDKAPYEVASRKPRQGSKEIRLWPARRETMFDETCRSLKKIL